MDTQIDPQTRQSQDEDDQKLGYELANILTPVIGISELLMHRAGDVDAGVARAASEPVGEEEPHAAPRRL